MSGRFDVVVVGGGHAGCEAALAAARVGCRTALVTLDRGAIGRMSCNPAIGGLGKGHLVREIDALGGEMGRAADETGIQFRLLNRSRGPAVRGPRAQADREHYAARMRRAIETAPSLTVVEGIVASLEVERAGRKPRLMGLVLADGRSIPTAAAVVTAGTFLRGSIHIGGRCAPGGRLGEPAAQAMSASLAGLGLRLGRLKTGTSPRLRLGSIDLERLHAQEGDPVPVPFSFDTDRIERPQIRCYRARTNAAVHDVVRAHLPASPLHDGSITAGGPRYCPSLEEKVARFPGRSSHPLVLEPEGYDRDLCYVNGLSTSLPEAAQAEIVRNIAGLEEAEILQPGYAVEYDFVDPRQLTHSLEVRGIEGLFLAGQIDGTTGYEEAAALGLIAGIGAAARAGACEAFTPSRSQAYIGVLVDDLVTRGTVEPYRMFTSRAEFRLLLDIDSADRRLAPHGRRLGLVDDERWSLHRERWSRADRALAWLRSTTVRPGRAERRRMRDSLGEEPGSGPISLDRLLARATVDLDGVERFVGAGSTPLSALDGPARGWVECRAKYEGYLARQGDEVRRLARAEGRRIPEGFVYRGLGGLSAETVEALERVRPRTLAQASRIPGLTPPAIALLDLHLEREDRGDVRGGPGRSGRGAGGSATA